MCPKTNLLIPIWYCLLPISGFVYFLFPAACCLFPFPDSHFPFHVSRFVFPTFHFRPSTTPIFDCPDSTRHLLHGICGLLICTFKFPFPNFLYSAFQIPGSGFPLLVSRFSFLISHFLFPFSRFPFLVSGILCAISGSIFNSKILKPKERFSDPVLEFSHSLLVLNFAKFFLLP